MIALLSRPTPSLSPWGVAACAAALLLASSAWAQPPQESSAAKRAADRQQRAQIALSAAQAAIEREDYATAVTLLENFLLEQPGDAPALFDLAYCYGLQGRTADAIDTYRQALEVDSKLFEARLNLGVLLLRVNKPAAAAAELTRALELEPDSSLAHLYTGAALEDSGEKQQALEHFQRAAGLDPKAVEPRRAALRLLLQNRDWKAAETLVQELLLLTPAEAELHLNQADLLLGQGKKEEALAAYEKYLQKVAGDDSAPPSTVGEIHLRAGRLTRELENGEEALRHFRAAQRAGGGTYKQASLVEQAKTLAWLERYQEALPLYEEAVAAAPDNPDLLAELGFVYLKTRSYTQAVPVLARVVQLAPQRVEAYNHLAAALTLSGNPAGAIQVLDRRAAYAEETTGTLFLRARNYDELGHCGSAIEYYEKFLALNDDTQSDSYFQATGRLRHLRKTCRERPPPVK